MPITISLPAQHFNRLSQKALRGSIADIALSRVDDSDETPQAVRVIDCDLPTARALHQLASACCTPALRIIDAAILQSRPR